MKIQVLVGLVLLTGCGANRSPSPVATTDASDTAAQAAVVDAADTVTNVVTSSKPVNTAEPAVAFKPSYGAGPRVYVYKTKGDYDRLVPVTLSKDKTTIVAYPHPSDLKKANAMPTELHKGYLLDNRGIGKNTAFLKWTYSEYAAMEGPPPLSELQEAIIDHNPLKELYDCGNKLAFKDPVEQLNNIIDSGGLATTFKTIIPERK